jgi:CDP-diacylglycerol--glycerol-3-phosphate 3-phosphatidyltransferase
MPVWMFLIMAWREIAMSYLRIVAEQKIGTMAARSSGKVKAFFQGATQLLVVFAYASMGPTLSPDLGLAVWLALLVSTVLSAGSLIDYILVIIRGLRAGSN